MHLQNMETIGEEESGIGSQTQLQSSESPMFRTPSPYQENLGPNAPSRQLRAISRRTSDNDVIFRVLKSSITEKLKQKRSELSRRQAELRRQHAGLKTACPEKFLKTPLSDLVKTLGLEKTNMKTILYQMAFINEDESLEGNKFSCRSPDFIFSTPYSQKTGTESTRKILLPVRQKNILKSGGAAASSSKANIWKSPMHVKFVGAVSPDDVQMREPKAPRLHKDGEILYSRSGSPILIPHPERFAVPCTPGPARNVTEVDKPVRLQVPDVKGNVIDVDIVYRGKPEERIGAQVFKGFVTDVRGLITMRSTTAKASRKRAVPRLPPKAVSAKKKKPDWH